MRCAPALNVRHGAFAISTLDETVEPYALHTISPQSPSERTASDATNEIPDAVPESRARGVRAAMSGRITEAITRLADAFEVYDDRKAEHKTATDLLKDAKELVEACARAVVEAQNPSAPSLFDDPDVTFTVSTAVDGADAEVVINGSTGAPIADAPIAGSAPIADTAPAMYALEPSKEDPRLCVCGWEIKSPAPGHGARHHRYAAALGEADPDAGPVPTKPRNIGRRAKA